MHSGSTNSGASVLNGMTGTLSTSKSSTSHSGLSVILEAQFWLNLQSEYDLPMMKRKIGDDIEQRIIPAKKRGSQMVTVEAQDLKNA